MKVNVGGIDRLLRLVFGAILIGVGVVGVGTPWTFIVGGILAGTALISFCPLYPIFGICTKES
ncbi:Protein of unknown function (DUF2892) [Mariprofundus ferrinatatus]|uniref:Inner membrane protein YgaP-like transmembrane domain-containing protein n=1 Tax=Mariprofundus ferrinatatus TaxID=1921087 RepID=A0A2K8L6I8_9PROT|nr:DUF2892 domain-containing protein [Mariprofundus ferrinatatus]ATX82843.1 Protein of unknown function (DUF2892) [Mariprofundus ferrinatatus]